MKIFIDSTESKINILISADENLDLSAYFTFREAASIANKSSLATSIFVDFTKTKKMFDSGKAMLLSLHQMSGHLKNPIYLTNVSPEIKHQFAQSEMPSTMILS